MKSLKPVICASVLSLALSTSAMAGNIGGMRTNSAGNIGGMRTNSAGNIGGLRSNRVGNIGGMRADAPGNIGGLRADVSTRDGLAVDFIGNISGFLWILYTVF